LFKRLATGEKIVRKSWLGAVIPLCLLMIGCDGDSAGVEVAVLPAELVGTWVANSTCSPSCSYTLTSTENPAAHADLVAVAGVTVNLHMQSNGAASLNLAGQTVSGTARVVNGALILTSGLSADTVDYSVAGGMLTLDFRTPILYDLNGDGTVYSSNARAVLKKD
jgi:hypothetical protein